MGYSCRIVKPDGMPYHFPAAHNVRGGMYVVGGTTEAYLYVTYNYGGIMRRAFGNTAGLETINGMSVAESIPIMKAAQAKLDPDNTEPQNKCDPQSYWAASESNVYKALENLLRLADWAPGEYIWEIE